VQVSVRLSSILAQQAGSSIVQVELAEEATIANLLEVLSAQNPALSQPLQTTVAIIAGRHVDRAQPLKAGQEVALLIPIAGGGNL
jgi:molybdopterin converting factor small subunit